MTNKPEVLSLVCEAFGSPSNLVLRRMPRAALKAGEVRIAVAHAAIGFGTTVLIEGRYQRHPELPFVPGTEISGVVLEVAPDVHALKPGDRVAGGIDWGGYAHEVVCGAATIYPVPQGVDLAAAACIPLTYGTSYAALHWRARLADGETVLVLGAAGGVGLAAVEIARAAGARVIATGSTDEKRALALAHGAQHALPADASTLRQAVLAATDGEGVDVVFDPVGGELAREALRCLRSEGRHVVIGFAGGEPPQAAFNILLVKNIDVIGFWFGQYLGWGRIDERLRYEPRMREMMAALFQGCLDGRLRPQGNMRFPLQRYPEAFGAVTGRQGIGRVLFDITPA